MNEGNELERLQLLVLEAKETIESQSQQIKRLMGEVEALETVLSLVVSHRIV